MRLHRIFNILVGFFVVILFFLVVFYTGIIYTLTLEPKVIIAEQTIKLAIADTPASQIQGLGQLSNICDLCGMLFIFEDLQVRAFWMKNMKFPLDIIWLKDNQVVGFAKDVAVPQSEDDLLLYYSPEPVNRVLEIKAGFADKYGLNVGETVEYLDLDFYR